MAQAPVVPPQVDLPPVVLEDSFPRHARRRRNEFRQAIVDSATLLVSHVNQQGKQRERVFLPRFGQHRGKWRCALRGLCEPEIQFLERALPRRFRATARPQISLLRSPRSRQRAAFPRAAPPPSSLARSLCDGRTTIPLPAQPPQAPLRRAPAAAISTTVVKTRRAPAA